MNNELVVEDVSIIALIKRSLYIFLKRLFDIICSLFGIIFLIPITVIVKILYIFSGDFNSVIFTQKRIGKDLELWFLIQMKFYLNYWKKILIWQKNISKIEN